MSDLSSTARTAARPNTVGAPTIVAGSAAMLEVLAIARRSAAGDAKVLVTGESGVGKDVIARLIHVTSKRASGPFIAVNCAGLTETLLESELFGHVKGSFTGAYRDKRGKLQMAHGGTLFLDEVGEMSLRMQALLLRFLETGEIQSVGAHDEIAPRGRRVIAATNRNLPERVAAGEFREDLLYRLRVIHIHVPPLRERRDDIPLLVAHLLKRTERTMEVSEDAMILLQRYRWPGNIRELQNVDRAGDVVCRPRDHRRRAPAAVGAQLRRGAAAAARTPPPDRRRSLRRAGIGRLFVLGTHPPDLPVARHHPPRHS